MQVTYGCPKCKGAMEEGPVTTRDGKTLYVGRRPRIALACACGHWEERHEPDEDDRHHEEAERFDEATGPWEATR